MADAQRACRDCLFFKWVEGKKGDCRRRPPTPFMLALPSSSPPILGTNSRPSMTSLQVQFPAAWPVVMENHWCGEYCRKDEPPQKEPIEPSLKRE